MSKHIDSNYLYQLPSGNAVHPCRLIQKDGTLMWKHALNCCGNTTYLPSSLSQEQHIIKTAQRLEELNSWVSQDLEQWESLIPYFWHSPFDPELQDGINVYFQHAVYDTEDIYTQLLPHIQEHETLEQRSDLLFFKRC